MSDFDDTSAEGAPRKRKGRQQTPLQRALGLLVRREHSGRELTRKLCARGVDPDEVEQAVARLREDGWQDDERFAQWLVRTRSNAGYGPLHIWAELGTHGLRGEQVEAAMATFEGDWGEVARTLVQRRFGQAGPQELAERRKASDMLMRRGFDGDSIRQAIRYERQD